MPKISAVIITFNEEKNIRRCLESLVGVVDEIVVIDSLSTDKTEVICKDFGVIFIQQEFLGYRAQKNFADSKASHDFILSLDADEALSDELKSSIISVREKWEFDAYEFNRLNNFYGKWTKYGGLYPDRKIRLFDRRKGEWNGVNLHERYLLYEDKKENVGFLTGDLLHWTITDFESHLNQINKFSSIAAEELLSRGKKISSFKVAYKSFWSFFRSYFLRLGMLDGYYGFVVSKMGAISVFQKYAKYKLMKNQQENK